MTERHEPSDARARPPAPGGRPDHHDPLAGVGGAPPAQSALTLRLVLACFGLLVCGGAAAAAGLGGWTAICAVLSVLAAIALADIAVVTFRKARGEPG